MTVHLLETAGGPARHEIPRCLSDERLARISTINNAVRALRSMGLVITGIESDGIPDGPYLKYAGRPAIAVVPPHSLPAAFVHAERHNHPNPDGTSTYSVYYMDVVVLWHHAGSVLTRLSKG